MAFKNEQVMQAQFEVLTNARAAAFARYESARGVEDDAETMDAADRILDCDAKLAALGRIAQDHAGHQAAPLPGGDDLSHRDVALARHYGLTAQELGAAKSWTSDASISDENRVRTYIENRQRYRSMRANGTYRDDRGR